MARSFFAQLQRFWKAFSLQRRTPNILQNNWDKIISTYEIAWQLFIEERG